MAAYPDRYHSIGINWANIWSDEMWSDGLADGIWAPNPLLSPRAPRPKQIDIRTLVVALDKNHKAPVKEYEFSNGRVFYDR
jgi:hypothetical protein